MSHKDLNSNLSYKRMGKLYKKTFSYWVIEI